MITDVCLCEYTTHGHCGVLREDGAVDNDATLELLARTAVSHARAGADLVAPSDMMDGRVRAIREELDAEGFSDTPILAYAAKFASAFYGPFREAAGSTPAFGDRRGYQLDPANGREALREVLLDVEEGADMVMVKPALAYGDLISAVKRETRLPVAAYNVCGEYAMVKAGGRRRSRRRARARARDPHLAAPRRRRRDHHLPRQGRRPMAGRAELSERRSLASARAQRPEAPQPQRRRGGGARRPRPPPAEPDAGQLPDRRAPLPARRRAWRTSRASARRRRWRACSACWRSASSARSRRSSTRARSATPRCWSPRRSTRATRTAPPQVINAHPGVSHNYLRNHEFNLWFTIATEPDSELGLEGTLEVLARESGAESVRQLPTLKLFKIRMDLEMEGDTQALASAVAGRASRSSSSRSPTTSATSR